MSEIDVTKLSWDDPRRIEAVRQKVEALTEEILREPGKAFQVLLETGFVTEDRKAVNFIKR